jgi:Threonine dehydrogenase and related Zn-dependent dehydrogenases
MKTKVVCTERPNVVRLEEVDIEPKANEVLVKTHMSSICGTDKNYSLGKMPRATKIEDLASIDSEAHRVYPLRMGHEGSGTIVAVGSGVTDFKVGDKVMSFGWYNTMAEYFVAPVRHNGYGVVKVPEGMSMDAAALGEPSSCAIYAGIQSGVELGDTVVIVGVGFAGQVIAQVVKKMGALKVICVDIVDSKLELAKSLGADIVINAEKEDVVDIVLRETNNLGADVVIEAAGTGKAIQTCTDVLKHGGIMGLYSWVLDPVNLYINRWHNDGFDIRTLAIMHRIKHDRLWWIHKTLANVANGMIKIEPLLSHIYSLDDAEKAFDTACNDPAACKVLLRP